MRSSKAHGVLVVEGDGAEYQPISAPLDNSQFVEQRRLAATEVARCFRIPPHMIGAPTSDNPIYATHRAAEHRLRPLLAHALA